MPIMDYKTKSENSKKALLNRKDITNENKQHLQNFFKAYEMKVKPARVDIFCTHIWQFLNKTKDVKKDMNNRELITNIFHSLKKQLSISHYATVIAVTKTLVRWLNSGNTPEGFNDVVSPKKKDLKRKLIKEDMWEWQDGLNTIGFINNSQWKAIIMTQLDGGFRPSEFTDLNYGDVEFKVPFLIVRVKDGKTGGREVILFNSVPYLQKWLSDHPTKNPKDPLWIMEYDKKSSRTEVKNNTLRYQYPAIAKRFAKICDKAKITKPHDFYNLRHSACRLAKLNNMPLELASKKFGHSVEFFVNTYGRLDVEDDIKRLKEHEGLLADKKSKEQPVFCNVCKTVNPPHTEICQQCKTPLTITKALEMKSEKDKEIEKLRKDMDNIKKTLFDDYKEQFKKEILKELRK